MKELERKGLIVLALMKQLSHGESTFGRKYV